jgi:hypothetical protein
MSTGHRLIAAGKTDWEKAIELTEINVHTN